MAFLFDGFLSTATQRRLELRASEYAYAIYAKDVTKLMKLALDEGLFLDYMVRREDCMGQAYQAPSHCYCTIPRHNEDGSKDGFLLLRSKAEYDSIVRHFPDEIIDANPFKTIVGR